MRSDDRPISTPIFDVRDMEEATTFYQKLGYEIVHLGDSYAVVVDRDQEVLHLELGLPAKPTKAYLNVVDVRSLYDKWARSGLELGSIADEPWGMTEFSVSDPSGNLLRVGQNL